MKKGPRFEMTAANLEEAIAMAEAATPNCRFGQYQADEKEWEAILAYGDGNEVWITWVPDPDVPEGTAIAAVTGNGPTSEANARFFAHARDIVLALGAEVLRLRTRHGSTPADTSTVEPKP